MTTATLRAMAFQSTLPTRGSDKWRPVCGMEGSIFQSTLPTRGSDTTAISTMHPHGNFNPRSPRGGATIRRLNPGRRCRYFNPRSPRGGATIYNHIVCDFDLISIHAPHEGERPYTQAQDNAMMAFQSTLPTRGSDVSFAEDAPLTAKISIHAPHEGERHLLQHVCYCTWANFNPRSPRGGATRPYRSN